MTTTQIQAKESLFTPSSDKEGNNGIRPTPPLVIPMQTLEFQLQQEAGWFVIIYSCVIFSFWKAKVIYWYACCFIVKKVRDIVMLIDGHGLYWMVLLNWNIDGSMDM